MVALALLFLARGYSPCHSREYCVVQLLLIALGVLNNLSAFIGGGHSHGTDLSRAPLLSHLYLVTPVCLKPEQKLCSVDPREYRGLLTISSVFSHLRY